MKFIFTLFLLYWAGNVSAQRCATPQYMGTHPSKTKVFHREQEAAKESRDTLPDEVIIIPVVVHVLYNTPEQNISDQQVISQIEALNKDYRRHNADTIHTPEAFRQFAADVRIQFCLAKVDPNGNYTTGILHKFTKSAQFLTDDAMKFSSLGGDDAWDASRYLNLWVCNLFGRTLGYAVLPDGPAEKDGVVIKYTSFGTTGSVRAPYNLGRTATHEIGHWLGLKHLWGDSLCGDDGIADTPPQETSNSYCPVFPNLSSCSINPSGDMFMNFMDFTDDGCMNLFTQGQKSEMRSLFALGNARNSFLNSNVCDSANAEGGPLPIEPVAENFKITTYPNPFNNQLTISANNGKDILGRVAKIYNVAGKLFTTRILQSQQTVLDVSNLPSGLYILKIESKEGSFIYKLLKQSDGQSR